VATSGQVNAARGAAEVKAALNGLAKGLADLGVSASENTSSSSYEGVIQQELPTALSDVRECRLKVFQTLQEKLLPDARSTPGPHSEQAPQKLDCGGNSDNQLGAPILNVFAALPAKDIALYSNQWSDRLKIPTTWTSRWAGAPSPTAVENATSSTAAGLVVGRSCKTSITCNA
jgi:hypothetical protein